MTCARRCLMMTCVPCSKSKPARLGPDLQALQILLIITDPNFERKKNVI